MPPDTSRHADIAKWPPASAWLAAGLGTLAADLLLQSWLGPVLAPQVALIAAATAALLVLLPSLSRQAARLTALGRVVFGTALMAALAQLLLGPVQAPAALALGSVMTGLLVGTVAAVLLLVPTPLRPAVHGLLLLALAALTLSPVWLAGSLDALARWPGTLDTLVAINPLTALAAGTQTDFLRMDWFYRHSPLGSLRFDYPPPAALLAGYGIAAGAAAALILVRDALARARRPQVDADGAQ